MSLLNIIFNRASVRRYTSKPVSEKVLRNILEAGSRAPSAMNAQPWHFIVVTEQKLKDQLSERRWTGFVKDAAFVMVGCGEKKSRWSTVDVAIALQNMVIAAEAQGLGSCWVGDFDQTELKEMLGLPDNLHVIAMVSFGHPAEKPAPHDKKSLDEIVHYNKF
jgi:nitroreductase